MRLALRSWHLIAFVNAAIVVACGARSSLLESSVSVDDGAGGATRGTSGSSTGMGGVVELTSSSGGIGGFPFEAGVDAAADAPPDVMDATLVDAGPPPPPVCDDAGVTFIYLLSESGVLSSYYPPTQAIAPIGTIDCTSAALPFSMAVDRGGTAYVIYENGHLFKVSTRDASCEPTSFVPDQHTFLTFGMGFSADMNDPAEKLFVVEASGGPASRGLATIDTTTFAFDFIHTFATPVGPTEMTGTGDGRLFGFSLDVPGPGSHVSEFDKTNAAILSSAALDVGTADSAYAVAFWGGGFYLFTAESQTNIHLYDPASGTVSLVTTIPQVIVGAGVSTCAPQ